MRPKCSALSSLKTIDDTFVSVNGHLLFEVHIFLAPLNPDAETRQRYYHAIDVFNETMKAEYGPFWKAMKSPFLALKFGSEYVNVMQSARYVYGLSYRQVLNRAFDEDVSLFMASGFDILRNL